MTHGQLFAGIGGFGLAAQWAGIENVWANEIDSFCCKVLRKNFVNLKIYERDIREIGKHNLEPVDIITGGFPCQPFSYAGKRKGKEDDRYLWPEMLRVIKEVRPSWVIGENVAGLKSMENGKTLEGILIDLEDIGYQVETFLIPACSVSAWHRRGRIWIVAHSTGNGKSRQNGESNSIKRGKPTLNDKEIRGQFETIQPKGLDDLSRNAPNTISTGLERWDGKELPKCENKLTIRQGNSQYDKRIWSTEPNVGRVAHGIPSRVDRLKSLGNAIVPQVAYEIFKAINGSKNNT